MAEVSKDKDPEGGKRFYTCITHFSSATARDTGHSQSKSERYRCHPIASSSPKHVYGSAVKCQIVCSTWRVGWCSTAISKSTSTDPLLGGAVFPGRTSGRSCKSRSTDCVAAARDRHRRWILVGTSRKAASLLTAWKLSRPFPHRLLRRFCTSDCLRPRPRCRRFTVG